MSKRDAAIYREDDIMDMWRISSWRYGSGEIEKIEVESATPKTVTYIYMDGARPRRESRSSDWAKWFDTEKEALEWLHEFTANRRGSLQRDLDKATANLAAITERLQALDNDAA